VKTQAQKSLAPINSRKTHPHWAGDGKMPSASFTSSRTYVRRSRRKGANRIAMPNRPTGNIMDPMLQQNVAAAGAGAGASGSNSSTGGGSNTNNNSSSSGSSSATSTSGGGGAAAAAAGAGATAAGASNSAEYFDSGQGASGSSGAASSGFSGSFYNALQMMDTTESSGAGTSQSTPPALGASSSATPFKLNTIFIFEFFKDDIFGIIINFYGR